LHTDTRVVFSVFVNHMFQHLMVPVKMDSQKQNVSKLPKMKFFTGRNVLIHEKRVQLQSNVVCTE